MSEGPWRYPPSTMRASDADRDAVLAELGEHFQAGRLTSDELAERTGLALQARTFGDLEPLTADLPAVRSADPMTGPAAGAIKPGRAWRPALAPIVLGLVVLMVVVGALMGAGTGARGSHLWWLILVVPLVARRVASRGRR
ncbi:MAG TPA: DUF1707 domain-containing protein [Streptosporangiaceae bacterium]|nr:DUF1707 domain-containing protein [Streptosporangiaceae bacterium]